MMLTDLLNQIPQLHNQWAVSRLNAGTIREVDTASVKHFTPHFSVPGRVDCRQLVQWATAQPWQAKVDLSKGFHTLPVAAAA